MKKSRLFSSAPIWCSILFLGIYSCNQQKNEGLLVQDAVFKQLPAAESWESDWSGKNQVIVHILTEPDNLHPANGSSQTRAEIFQYLHCGLLRTDLRTGTVQPGLVRSMPTFSKDQLTMTFDLRSEVRWDDGAALTADDVVFTVKAAKCPLTANVAFKPYFDGVGSVEKVPGDSLKVLVRMKKVMVQNIALWADYPILQRKQFDPDNILGRYSFEHFADSTFNAASFSDLKQWAVSFNADKNGFDPACVSGLGPYALREWQQGQLIVLEKKKKHWMEGSGNYYERSGPANILYKVGKDPVAQELSFLKQEYDASTVLSSRSLLKLKEDSLFNRNYYSGFVDVYGYTFVGINMRADPESPSAALRELEVRKALALLTPIENIIRLVNKGVNKRVAGPVARMKKSCHQQLALVPFDVKKAETLLEMAGWKRGTDGIRCKIINGKERKLRFELLYLSVIPEWKEMATLMESTMAEAGVKILPIACDLNTWLEKGTTHQFDLLMGTLNSSALPEDYAQLWSTDSWKNNGLNFSGFGDAATDALIDSINTTLDETVRNSMEYRMQQKIYDAQAFVFLYGLVRRVAVHKRFEGVEFYPERPGVLYNVMRLNRLSPGVTVDAGS